MDFIPFYYQNGQLEAIASMHQMLKQSSSSGGTQMFNFSQGISEAIARELVARGTRPTEQRATTIVPPRTVVTLQANGPKRSREETASGASSSHRFPGGSQSDHPSPMHQPQPKKRRMMARMMVVEAEEYNNNASDNNDSEPSSDVDVEVMTDAAAATALGAADASPAPPAPPRNEPPAVAAWRAAFDGTITERYQNRCRRRNMLCRRMAQFNAQRLRATADIALAQLSLTDLRIREKYALAEHAKVASSDNDAASLVQRGTGRQFVCVEDMFDVLWRMHVARCRPGIGSSQRTILAKARRRFANISDKIVREFLRGCVQCEGGRHSKAPQKGAEAGSGSAPEHSAELRIGGLTLEQFFAQNGGDGTTE